MKDVYLDINGNILNEILGLEPDNRIDAILEEIIDASPTGSKSKPKKEKVKEEKPKKTKSKAKKTKDEPEEKIRMIKIKRIK